MAAVEGEVQGAIRRAVGQQAEGEGLAAPVAAQAQVATRLAQVGPELTGDLGDAELGMTGVQDQVGAQVGGGGIRATGRWPAREGALGLEPAGPIAGQGGEIRQVQGPVQGVGQTRRAIAGGCQRGDVLARSLGTRRLGGTAGGQDPKLGAGDLGAGELPGITNLGGGHRQPGLGTEEAQGGSGGPGQIHLAVGLEPRRVAGGSAEGEMCLDLGLTGQILTGQGGQGGEIGQGEGRLSR